MKEAVFGGALDDVCAELCLEISLIYGGIARQNKKMANEFRTKLMMAIIDPEVSETIFSTGLVDALHDSDKYECGNVVLDNPKELLKQLREILEDEGK